MKTRSVVGILLLAGIGIGAFLAKYLPDSFGIGDGFSGIGNDNTKVSTTSETESPAVPEGTGSQVGVDVLVVLIDGHDYLLETGTGDDVVYQPTSLEEIAEQAELATGDKNGVKVRVLRRVSARASAENALKDKLESAGIKSGSVRWHEDPVP